MRILLVSDVESSYIWDYFDTERFKNIDLIISCGDLKNDYLSFLTTMVNAPLFYVYGNHDIQYEEEPPGGCENIEDRLVVYKGLRIIGLGGCIQYNKQPNYSRPPFQYTESQMKARIRRLRLQLLIHRGFDILVTHAPAFGVGDGTDKCHRGFSSFLWLLDKYKPLYMFHGHMHLGFGKGKRIIQYNDTQIVDAYKYYILDIDSNNLSR